MSRLQAGLLQNLQATTNNIAINKLNKQIIAAKEFTKEVGQKILELTQ
jgi:hypothetical protein